MDNTENKNQELQGFAKDIKDEMEALMAKAMDEKRCMFEEAMARQNDVAKRNMEMFQDAMSELAYAFRSALKEQQAIFEKYLMVLGEEMKTDAEQRLDEMKTMRADIFYNLTKMRTESTKHE